jgi:hypothetical protein
MKVGSPMRRITQAFIAVGVLAIVASLFGCEKAEEVVDQAQDVREAAKATEELEEEGRTRVKTDEGEVEIAEGAAASDLDIPVYPGAQQQDAREIDMPTVQGVEAQFTSSDPFEDVATFYRNEFPDAKTGEVSEGDEERFMLSTQEGARESAIVVTKDADEDAVHIELAQKVTKDDE